MAHSWPWSQGMAQEEDDPQDSRDMVLHTPGWGNEAWPPAWLPAPIRPMRGSVGRFSAAAVSSREECKQCPGLFWRFTGVRPCGPRQDGCRLQGSVSYNKPVTCVAVIFEHFARRLAKHEYDIVVGRKCRLSSIAAGAFSDFIAGQFFRSSFFKKLTPVASCTELQKHGDMCILEGSRPGLGHAWLS